MNNLIERLSPPFYTAILYDKTPPHLKMHNCHVAAFDEMVSIAPNQPGFLGLKTKKETGGRWSSTSYWRDLKSLKEWKRAGDKKIRLLHGDIEPTNTYILEAKKINRDRTKNPFQSISLKSSGFFELKKTNFLNLFSRYFQYE